MNIISCIFDIFSWQSEGVEGTMVEQEFILTDVLHGKAEEEETVTGTNILSTTKIFWDVQAKSLTNLFSQATYFYYSFA